MRCSPAQRRSILVFGSSMQSTSTTNSEDADARLRIGHGRTPECSAE